MGDVKHTIRKSGRHTNKNDNRYAIIWRNSAADICVPGVIYTAKEIIGIILDSKEPSLPGGRVKSYRWEPTPMKLTKMLRRDDRFTEIKKQTLSVKSVTTTWTRNEENKLEVDQSACLYAGTGMSVYGGAEAPTKNNKKKNNGDE